MHDPDFHRPVIIVGGGAAGAAAALGLDHPAALMLDVGITGTPSPLPDAPVHTLLSSANGADDVRRLDDALIGSGFESILRPHERDLSIKIKGPHMRFIIARPADFPTDEHMGCSTVQSFAIGGLANAWGAGAMRYTARELQYFPFPAAEIEEGFDVLTAHIGISGCATDDLVEYFGSTSGLLPELDMCEVCSRFLRTYERRKEVFRNRGIRVGRPRLAVLPIDHGGRKRFQASGQEFFSAPHEGIYSPAFTIQELTRHGRLEYRRGIIVERFEVRSDRVVVFAYDLDRQCRAVFSANELILAAGTINTSRIVLRSRHDAPARLPLLDNPVSFVPIVDLQRIGRPLHAATFMGAELILVMDRSGAELPVQGSLYSLLGPLRSDLVGEFPLSAAGNVAATRYLGPAMLILQLFHPDVPRSGNYLELLPTGGLRVVHEPVRSSGVERELVRVLRAVGYAASTLLCRRPPPGGSIHYAGTLPARHCPTGAFETNAECRLPWAQRVTIADASTFPVLPAKNHTFMLMANAFRVGKKARHRLGSRS